jgi:hypothetical protein
LLFTSEGGAVHAEDLNATATIPVEELNEQDGETVTVIGRGIGVDLESAQKDAQKSAVEKAVGLLLDAETVLENDEIVETILTYSGAYIEKYETLETKKEDTGLFRVKIKAEVKKTQLEQKLVEEKLITKKVDGKSIFAKARTKLNEKNSSALIFRKAFEGFPLGLVKASVDGEPELVAEEEGSVRFGVKVRMELDEEAWESWVARLDKLLGPVARQKGTWKPGRFRSYSDLKKAEKNPRIFGKSRLWSTQFPKGTSRESFEKAGLPWGDDANFLFLIAKGPGPGKEWNWYSLPRDPLLFELVRVWPSHIALGVSLVDAEGATLVRQIFSSSLPFKSVDFHSGLMGATPLGVIYNERLDGFAQATGEFYTDWIATSRVSPRTNYTAIQMRGKPADVVNGFGGVVFPAGFFSDHALTVDSYTLPLLLDVPMDALETADHVEVRLSEEKLWSQDSIRIRTKRGDSTTRKTVEWKVPEDGSK